jgi:hypothetical protein
MSETELRNISFREEGKKASEAPIAVACPLIRDVIDYADEVFWRCLKVAKRPNCEDYPPLALYRHIIEMTDGIEVLISEGCSAPCNPLLRTVFEARLNLMYILENKKHYEKRSLAWLWAYLHKKIEQEEMLDPSTPGGKKLEKAMRKEVPEGLLKLRPVDGVKELQELSREPHFAPIEEEYQRLKEKRVKHPYWASLATGGPNSFPELANYLSQGSYYLVFYNIWSQLIHGFDATRFLAKLPNGSSRFKLLRDPKGLKNIANTAILLLNMSTKLMLRKFLPGEDFSEWEAGVMKRMKRLDRFQLKQTYSRVPLKPPE